MRSREAAWERLSQPLDVLVIGGGITGAGVLLEASRRGLRAALVERGDFASGTSSRSSKLVHGGLRYLKEGKLRLTRESVQEREALLREAPDLVHPMPFLMPHYRGSRASGISIQFGLWMYDVLAKTRNRGYLTPHETLEREPLIAPKGLVGAHRFADATTDDARLVMRVMACAEQHGGTAINYAEVTAFENADKRVAAAHVRNRDTGEVQTVHARAFVNATGACADVLRGTFGRTPRLRPLRGSHLLVRHERLPLAHAVAFAHPHDARPVFAYPWMGMTLIGTTDLDHTEDLHAEATISREEVAYLLDALGAQFPNARISRGDIVSTFAGVRPVVASGKANPSRESRDHLLLEEDGLITITGGKLTTFRPMALLTLRALSRVLGKPIDLRDKPIFEGAELLPTPGDLWERLRDAMRTEQVVHLDDLLLRRTRLALQLGQGIAQAFERLEPLCIEELGWTSERWNSESQAFLARMRTHYGVPQ
jgi:glycerol-3-phosphate dehydrogenase